MISKIRELIGDLWGHTTTQLLAVLVAIQPIGAALAPELLTPQIKWGLVGLAAVIAVLRLWAPPPRSEVIRQDDAVVVNHRDGTIVIAKAEEIPASTVSKAAGEA